MHIMFVRWITAPVSAGCVHFHEDEPMDWRPWRQQIIDLPAYIITSADGDGNIRRLNEPGFMVLIRWNPGHCKFAVARRRNAELCITRQVQGSRCAGPYIFTFDAIPTAAIGVHRNRSAQNDDCQFIFPAIERPCIAYAQASSLKGNKIPPG